MKVAVSTDRNQVSAHFGRCPVFTIADIEMGKIKSKKEISNPGHRAGFIPEFLSKSGVECIIAGGMGNRAIMMFKDKNIEVILGIFGNVDEVLDNLVKGSLKGAESFCSPGSGKGYGIEREDKEHN